MIGSIAEKSAKLGIFGVIEIAKISNSNEITLFCNIFFLCAPASALICCLPCKTVKAKIIPLLTKLRFRHDDGDVRSK